MPKRIDLAGQRFGLLIVKEFLFSDPKRGSVWICQCDCGKTANYFASSLKNGNTVTCGDRSHRYIDLKDKVFGLWKVNYLDIQKSDLGGQAYWNCTCRCGRMKSIRGSALTSKNSQSCRCNAIAVSKEVNSLPKGIASFNSVIGRYKREAKERKLEWALTDEQFRLKCAEACNYCGVGPSNLSANPSLNGEYKYNGLDRVNNRLGYSDSNTVPCCKFCNRIKYKNTVEEFLEAVKRIYQFQMKKLTTIQNK